MATDWERVETVTDFIFLGSNITVDGDCSHEIKRCLLFERKATTNLNSIELKSPLMKVKKESEKANWKCSIHKTKIMASGPITSWQIEGEKVKTETDFIFFSSKITVDGDCSHEIKRCLLVGRKIITNLGSRLKSRDITLLTKVHLIKAMVFP